MTCYKKAIMGGKINIKLVFFGVRLLGELGWRRLSEGLKKHWVSLIFDEKTLIFINVHFF